MKKLNGNDYSTVVILPDGTVAQQVYVVKDKISEPFTFNAEQTATVLLDPIPTKRLVTFELDAGFDFYAPTTALASDGRVILMAWMQMWGRTMPTAELHHGWCGMLTLPREIEILKNEFHQRPAKEVYSAFETTPIRYEGTIKEAISLEPKRKSACFLKIDCPNPTDFLLEIRKGTDCETRISLQNSLIMIDRSQSGNPIQDRHPFQTSNQRVLDVSKETALHLEVFLDSSSVELFVNDRYAMSATLYPFSESEGICFSSKNGINTTILCFSLRSVEKK